MVNPRTRTRQNKLVRQQPGGTECLEAIEFFSTMLIELERRADEGDKWAAEKISIAESAVDRLNLIRAAILGKPSRRRQVERDMNEQLDG